MLRIINFDCVNVDELNTIAKNIITLQPTTHVLISTKPTDKSVNLIMTMTDKLTITSVIMNALTQLQGNFILRIRIIELELENTVMHTLSINLYLTDTVNTLIDVIILTETNVIKQILCLMTVG